MPRIVRRTPRVCAASLSVSTISGISGPVLRRLGLLSFDTGDDLLGEGFILAVSAAAVRVLDDRLTRARGLLQGRVLADDGRERQVPERLLNPREHLPVVV